MDATVAVAQAISVRVPQREENRADVVAGIIRKANTVTTPVTRTANVITTPSNA